MRDTIGLLSGSMKAMIERVEDPKNASKGEFPTDMAEAVSLYYDEIRELDYELTTDEGIDFERTRYEAADVMVCLAMIINICDKKLLTKQA